MDAQGRNRAHFFEEQGQWYFGRENGESVGPFDRIYEIVMNACVVGTWECKAREITGEELDATLSAC